MSLSLLKQHVSYVKESKLPFVRRAVVLLYVGDVFYGLVINEILSPRAMVISINLLTSVHFLLHIYTVFDFRIAARYFMTSRFCSIRRLL